MSTRRDRAARAVALGIWPHIEVADPEMVEAYRIGDMVLAEVDRIPDVSELVEASSLGTPAAKAARASVSDVQVQRAIDVANRVRSRGSRPDPDSPDDFLCAFMFHSGELCERAAGHTGECTPNGIPALPPRCDCEGPYDEGEHYPSCPVYEPGSETGGGVGSEASRNDSGTAPPSPTLGHSACACVCLRHGTTQPCGCVCLKHPPTDDGAVRTGEEDHSLAAGARSPGPVVTPLDLARHPRTFELYRHRDVTGKSGTGVVAWGAVWPDGTVSLRWAGETQSFSNWDSLDVLVAVHGHEGATEVRRLDGGE